MKISTKFYIYLFFIIGLFLLSMTVTYQLITQHLQGHIDDEIKVMIAHKKLEFLAPIVKAEFKFTRRQDLFRRIHKDVLESYKKNSAINLAELKKATTEKFNLKNIDIDIFLINRQHIVYDTTYKKDIGLDIGAIWEETAHTIDLAFSSDKLISKPELVVDPIDGYFKLYSYVKLNDKTVLEMSFVDKENYNSSKKTDNSEYYSVVTDDGVNYVYLPKNNKDNMSKNSIYKNFKTFTKDNKKNDLVGKAMLTKKHVLINKGKSTTVYALLQHESLNVFLKNIVVKFNIDTTNQHRSQQKIRNVFLILLTIYILTFVVISWTIKNRLSKPLILILNSIIENMPLDESSFISTDFKEVARAYNELREKLKKYSDKISYHNGELAERNRIAHDLHDDLGGKLLYLSMQKGKYGDYAGQVLQDLRVLTHSLSNEDSTLDALLADVRYRVNELCESKNIEFIIDIDITNEIGDKQLPSHITANIICVCRELTRNAIQNDSTTRLTLTFSVDETSCILCIENDGNITNPDEWKKGLGMVSTQRRIHQLRGRIQWQTSDTGGVTCRCEWKTKEMYQKVISL